MRENGFLETRWSEVDLGEVLSKKPGPALITARVSDPIGDVIALMKKHDISQVPALDAQGNLAGLVTEVDLLKYMVENGPDASTSQPIRPIVEKAEAVYPASTSLEEVLPQVLDGYVILVTEGERPTGVLTKIDVLDFIAQRN